MDSNGLKEVLSKISSVELSKRLRTESIEEVYQSLLKEDKVNTIKNKNFTL